MRKIGLTGGIASGKSTVAKELRFAGFPVIDADVVAREVVQVGTSTLTKIFETFGTHLQQEDGSLDRKALGQIIFSNAEQREKLNRLVHPNVAKRVQEKMKQYEQNGEELVIYEVPLLFENQIEKQLDEVILVAISEEKQLERLCQRDHISKEEALSRIQSQMPLAQKRELADYIIENEGTIDDLKKEITNVLQQIKKKEPNKIK